MLRAATLPAAIALITVAGPVWQSPPTNTLPGPSAARNIDTYLGYNHKIACEAEAPDPRPNDRVPYGRVELIERPARERRGDFEDVECGMSLEEVRQECGRCLRCDHFGAGATEGGRHQYE